jgi:hypothetical protein
MLLCKGDTEIEYISKTKLTESLGYGGIKLL